jgi:hypothetical protein
MIFPAAVRAIPLPDKVKRIFPPFKKCLDMPNPWWVAKLLKMRENVETEEPEPTPEPATAPEPVYQSHAFLWKHESESRGGAAVILPCDIRQEDVGKSNSDKRCLIINGDKNQVAERRKDYANGDRIHFFLKKKGEKYGGKVKIVLILRDGSTMKWKVSNGAKRKEIR